MNRANPEPGTAETLVGRLSAGLQFKAAPSGSAALSVSPRTSTCPALIVDTFRIVAAILLCVHFVNQVRLTVPLLGEGRVWQPSAIGNGFFAHLVENVLRLGAAALRAWFGVSTALALAIILGLAPRVCALVLLFASAAMYRVLQPAVTVDDYMAEALAFWLVLLPTGTSLKLATLRRWRQWATARVALPAVIECGLFFLVLLMGTSVLDPGVPPTARFGFFAAAALALLGGRARTLAVTVAAASLWLAGILGHSLLGWASIAVCGLCLGVLLPRCPDRPSAIDPKVESVPFGAGAAVGAIAIALLALQIAAIAVRRTDVVRSTGALLMYAGISSPWDIPLNLARDSEIDFGFVPDGADHTHLELGKDSNPRLQAVLRSLENPSTMRESAREATIRGLIAPHCESATGAAAHPENLVLFRTGQDKKRLAWFRCGRRGFGADVVVLDATSKDTTNRIITYRMGQTE